MSDMKLSAEQVENWRRVLSGQIGSLASIMPDSEIQLIRNRYQKVLDESSLSEDADETAE